MKVYRNVHQKKFCQFNQLFNFTRKLLNKIKMNKNMKTKKGIDRFEENVLTSAELKQIKGGMSLIEVIVAASITIVTSGAVMTEE